MSPTFWCWYLSIGICSFGECCQQDQMSVDELVVLNIDNNEQASEFSVNFSGKSGKVLSHEQLLEGFDETTGAVVGKWVRLNKLELYRTNVTDVFKTEAAKTTDGSTYAVVPFPGAEVVMRGHGFELKLMELSRGGTIGRSVDFKATASFEPYHGMRCRSQINRS